MLFLILPDGHLIGMVEQDVRRHEDGVSEEAGVHLFVPCAVVLEGMCFLKHPVRGETAQVPREFADLGDIALPVEIVGRAVEPESRPGCSHFEAVLPSCFAIADRGEGMEIGDEKEGLVFLFIGQLDRRENGSQYIAQMWSSRALDPC
jgi:hypothetical protein